MISVEQKLQIKDAILSLGYTNQMFQENFSFLGRKGTTTADMIAFGDLRHFDLETACIGVHYSQNGNLQILDDFRMLAIPYGFVAYENKVEIWPLSSEGIEKHKKIECSYEQLNTYLQKNRISFARSTIMKAKNQGRQLSFAEIDMALLYQWGFNTTKKKLKLNIESAIENARTKVDNSQLNNLTKISIRLLAASILQDKRYIDVPFNLYNNAIETLKLAQEKYSNYFRTEDTQIFDKYFLDDLLYDIRAGSCIFTNLTTEMLDHLYQYAFVNDELRKELGIYATPPKLARMIANNLPFEDIRPEELYLLDGTCGSGSLLVAGHKRIYDLLSVSKSEKEKHKYLSDHILGVDKDAFAAEISGLSLLHESLPSGNSWKIKIKDFTKITLNDFDARPSIILANPPYREVRGESHIEKAIPFIEKNLDLLIDYGLMAIILPETFLQKSSCKNIRKRILEECEIFEIWQLPEGIFDESASATTVLFLRKNLLKPKIFPVRVGRVVKNDRNEFINRGYKSFSYIFPNQGNWNSEQNTFQIIPNIFQNLWEKLFKFQKLGEIAEIRNGINPGSGREDHFCHDNPPKGWKKWLNGPSAIRHFLIDWENQRKSSNRPFGNRYVYWPGDLEKPRKNLKEFFEGKNCKIIINARRNPNTRWRIAAAIDDVGYYPSYDLHLIFNLKEDIGLEELTAVLNHSIVTAFVDDHIRAKYSNINLLEQIPIPKFHECQKSELKKLVRELMQESNSRQSIQIQLKIDDIVNKAYGLTDDEKKALRDAGFIREKVYATAYQSTFPEQTWIVTGIVEDVNAKDKKMKVWFRGFTDEAIKVVIPRNMPGWALRPNTSFKAEIPFEDRYNPDWAKLYNFRPMRYSYMSEEELLRNLESRG